MYLILIYYNNVPRGTYKKLNNMTKKLLEKIANKVIFFIKEELEKNDSISSGDLRNNISAVYGNDKIGIEMLEYATYVDEGTKPRDKMPPIEPIRRWTQNKGILVSPWAIATNIMKFGTKPHPFLYIIEDIDLSELIIQEVNYDLENIKFEKRKINLVL